MNNNKGSNKELRCFDMMTVKKIIYVMLLGSASFMTGCGVLYGEEGVFRSKSKDYLKAGTLPPIRVPEGMQTANLSPLYVVPSVNARDDFGDPLDLHDYDVPQPAGANTEKGEVGVKLQKLGDNKWIFLSASTSQVWPRTQNFLTQYGIPVIAADPSKGLIETGDVAFKDDKEYTSRFKIFIQKGIHPETTEVHLQQTQYPRGGDPSQITWGETSADVEKERLLLDELAGVLAESVNNNSASLLGQNVGGNTKVEFFSRQGEPAMRLHLFLERARATVAHALTRDGFKLWDESAGTGIYYVAFDEDYDEDRSWIGRMFHNELPDKPRYPLSQVLQHLSNSEASTSLFKQFNQAQFNSPLKKAKGYLVVMLDTDKGQEVVIRDVRGEPIDSDKAKEFLRLIRKNLI